MVHRRLSLVHPLLLLRAGRRRDPTHRPAGRAHDADVARPRGEPWGEVPRCPDGTGTGGAAAQVLLGRDRLARNVHTRCVARAARHRARAGAGGERRARPGREAEAAEQLGVVDPAGAAAIGERRRGLDAEDRETASKGTVLDRKAVEAQQKDSAFVLTTAQSRTGSGSGCATRAPAEAPPGSASLRAGQTARKGTVLDRKAVETQGEGSALVLTAAGRVGRPHRPLQPLAFRAQLPLDVRRQPGPAFGRALTR
eukprot:SAG22_NODE_577_length_8975_cov_12.406827_7_plen_254_part_00